MLWPFNQGIAASVAEALHAEEVEAEAVAEAKVGKVRRKHTVPTGLVSLVAR